jgi:sugar phosphate isomerase/epimerase
MGSSPFVSGTGWGGNPPRVSVGSWAFAFGPYEADPWSFSRVCEYAASVGYDGVEINGFRPHPHQDDFLDGSAAKGLKARIEDLGLGVSAYAPDFRLFPPSRTAPARYLHEIDKSRSFCEGLEIKRLRVDTIIPPLEMSKEEYQSNFALLVSTWSAAAERCESSGVTLIWEFEPGFWLNRPSEIERVVTSINHPNFGILFDSSHAFTSGVRGVRQGKDPELVESVTDYALRLLPFIKHLHLADSDGLLHDEDTSVHTPLGHGKIDFPRLVEVLTPIAEQVEWWCVDMCYCEDADVKATESLAYVRDLERRAVSAEQLGR